MRRGWCIVLLVCLLAALLAVPAGGSGTFSVSATAYEGAAPKGAHKYVVNIGGSYQETYGSLPTVLIPTE